MGTMKLTKVQKHLLIRLNNIAIKELAQKRTPPHYIHLPFTTQAILERLQKAGLIELYKQDGGFLQQHAAYDMTLKGRKAAKDYEKFYQEAIARRQKK